MKRIISIKEWKSFNENMLVPRNIEGRKDKLRQQRIILLSKDIIEGDLVIDETFEGIPEELIKVKEIKGNVSLLLFNDHILFWLKDVKIYGNFSCAENNLTSLENCPQYISGSFDCSNNDINSFEHGPVYVGGDYICYNNTYVLDTKYLAKYIGGNLYCSKKLDITTMSKNIIIKGKIIKY